MNIRTQLLYNKLALLKIVTLIHKIKILLDEIESSSEEIKGRMEDSEQLDLFKDLRDNK